MGQRCEDDDRSPERCPETESGHKDRTPRRKARKRYVDFALEIDESETSDDVEFGTCAAAKVGEDIATPDAKSARLADLSTFKHARISMTLSGVQSLAAIQLPGQALLGARLPKWIVVPCVFFAVVVIVCTLPFDNAMRSAANAVAFGSIADKRSCTVPLPVPFAANLPLSHSLLGPPAERNKTRVPNIVHFVFGYNPDSTVFSFINYVAVLSALHVLRPDQVMMHCLYEPTGFFWDLVKPFVKLVQGRDVHSVFGNPVDHYAHKADIIRLEVLLEYGGIYLDADVVTLRPFGDVMDSECTLGQEGQDRMFLSRKVGLCNGVVAAAPNATFLRLWYEEYRMFDQEKWNFHSVQLPQKIASAQPEIVSQRSFDTFHWPLWDSAGMDLMMDSFEYNYTNNLAVHVWNHGMARSRYNDFAIPWCFECHSTLVSMMRSYVPDPLFSVVMPCHNQAHLVAEALDSVLAQAIPSWEIIVVDDKSPDQCGSVAEAWGRQKLSREQQTRLRVVVNGQNLGLAESRNTAIRLARGVWICALDADDKIGPDYFSAASTAMSKRPDLQLIYSNQRFFGGSSWLWEVPDFATETATVSGPLPVMSLYRREVWVAAGGYSSALPWGNEDYDFWLKLVELGVRHEKLEGAHVLYRYKWFSGMQRESESYTQEERAMLHSRHSLLYHPAQLLQRHKVVANMADKTRERLLKLQDKPSVSAEDRAYGQLWLALADANAGRHKEAQKRLVDILEVPSLQWQPRYHYARAACKLRDFASSSHLFADLAKQYPALAATEDFRLDRRSCEKVTAWLPSVERRDLVAVGIDSETDDQNVVLPLYSPTLKARASALL
jgi:GT2 family glycosyltransferase